MLWENLLQALSAIRANKMRSFLTMLGIIIGITAVIAIITLGQALQIFINTNAQSMGASMIVVSVKERSDESDISSVWSTSTSTMTPQESDLISLEDMATMKEALNGKIKAIGVLGNGGYGYLQEGRRRANIQLQGVNPDFLDAQGIKILSGRWINDADLTANKRITVISENAAESLFGSSEKAVGQEVKLNINNTIQTYAVVGVCKYDSQLAAMMMSSASMPTDMYVPITVMQLDFDLTKNFSTLYVAGEIGESVSGLTDDINDYLTPMYRNNSNFVAEAQNFESQMETFNQILGMVNTAIGIIAGISLLVGGVGVMNIMLVSVTERTREIGTRKAIGARSSSIRMQFIIESLILCGIGGLIGMILGNIVGILGSAVLLSAFGGSATTLQMAPVWAMVASVVFSMLIGIFFGAYPANKASQLQPIEALRYE